MRLGRTAALSTRLHAYLSPGRMAYGLNLALASFTGPWVLPA